MLTASRLSPPSGKSSSKPGLDTPYVTLNTGAPMPLIAFGTLMETLQPDPTGTVSLIEDAIDVGYRHLDTAQIYNTEPMVGEAIRNQVKSGKITRADMFVTTKLWRNHHRQSDVGPSLRASLDRLRLDYVELFLIHWPTAFQSGTEMFPKKDGKLIYGDIDYIETWQGMEDCVEHGLAKAIGVSNFNSKQLQRLMDNCRIKPANLQVEVHPYLNNKKLIDFCQSRGITVMAYAPLFGFNKSFRDKQGWPTIFEDSKIKKVAQKYKCTPAQVALKYQLQRGVGVAPKSAQRHRMEENYAAQLVSLTQEDMALIDSCNQTLRLNAEFPDHPYYPFHDEF